MNSICKILDAIYVICLIIFVVASIAMLLVQCFCLITMNGSASQAIYDFVIPKGGFVASIAVLAVVTPASLAPAAKKTAVCSRRTKPARHTVPGRRFSLCPHPGKTNKKSCIQTKKQIQCGLAQTDAAPSTQTIFKHVGD